MPSFYGSHNLDMKSPREYFISLTLVKNLCDGQMDNRGQKYSAGAFQQRFLRRICTAKTYLSRWHKAIMYRIVISRRYQGMSINLQLHTHGTHTSCGISETKNSENGMEIVVIDVEHKRNNILV
jgi:hypothetical protein